MEKKIRTKMVEVPEEYYVAADGTEFDTEDQCLEHENKPYRRLIKRETKSKRVNLLIRPSDYETLFALAEQYGVSLNELINLFIRNGLKNTSDTTI